MKVTGAEFMDWYDHHFPEGYYHDDGIDTHDDQGEWLLDPAATYNTSDLGYVAYDSGHDPEKNLSVEGQIRAYRRAHRFDPVMIKVPKGRLAEVKLALRDLGVKWPE